MRFNARAACAQLGGIRAPRLMGRKANADEVLPEERLRVRGASVGAAVIGRQRKGEFALNTHGPTTLHGD